MMRKLWITCLLLAAVGCLGETSPRLEPTRGYILISLDTLRADHLGCYGYARDTSPFLDSLAREGWLFENTYAHLPGTLPSHMSIFTGLQPSEHNVFPPDGVLSPRIRTLPEVFQGGGFRTAGHSEGGYVHGAYGFERGFDEWSHEAGKIETDVERTFARGLDFLTRLGPEDRFFLFLHTYAIHDPYYPEASYLARFWDGEAPPGVVDPTGPNLSELNHRGERPSAEVMDYYRALYDAQIRYVDDVLRDFFARLAELGLRDETTIVLTSDHGEEFLEHGKLLHTQLYREHLHVPLVFLHPGIEAGRRIATLARSIDLAPTLYNLARLEAPSPISGRSLLPVVDAEPPVTPRDAVARVAGAPDRTLVRQEKGEIRQLLWRPYTDGDEDEDEDGGGDGGRWVSRELVFDVLGHELRAEVTSFHRPRRLAVWVDGEPAAGVGFEPPREGKRVWVSRAVDFRAEPGEVRLAVESFHRPRRVEVRVDGKPLAGVVELLPLADAGDHWVSREISYDTTAPRLELVVESFHSARRLDVRVDGTPAQEVWVEPVRRDDVGFWVRDAVSIEASGDAADWRVASFHRSRRLEVRIDGELHDSFEIGPRELALAPHLPADAAAHRVTLTADSCDVPAEVGQGVDRRCLAFFLSGVSAASRVRLETASAPGMATLVPGPRIVGIELPPGDGARKVTLAADGCEVPAELGLSADQRCLAFQVLSGFGEQGFAPLDTDPVALRFTVPPGDGPRRVQLVADSCEVPSELGLSADERCLAFQILDRRGLESLRELPDPLSIPTTPQTLIVDLPGERRKKRVRLLTESCDVPREVLPDSEDERCLSFRIAGPDLWRIELYDNLRDPRQSVDLGLTDVDQSLALLRVLRGYRFEAVAPGETLELDPEQRQRLRALGYLE